MRHLGTAVAFLLAACGGGSSQVDGGGDGDGDGGPPADSTPPPPMCPDGGSTGVEATIPGEVTVPNPTLRNLTLEWAIEGDSDLDGAVTVRFRVEGTDAWRAGTALQRIPAGSVEGFSWANRHSGSVFDLAPDTSYEVELALSDPDGGCEIRTVVARTRPVPAPMDGAPVISVTPSTIGAALDAAEPGDIIELGAGTYAGWDFYTSGTEGAPIVFRGTPGAVVDGKYLLRACVVNFRTRSADVDALMDVVRRLGRAIDAAERPAGLD